MCAINGITTEDRDIVTKMNEITKHRGSDGSRIYMTDGITLGHNRLAIIDLHERSSQPMTSNNQRYTIVYNGELYNYSALKKELETQYEFKTDGDTEVLLAAYVVWGSEMLSRLNGIFAFAIWDSVQKILLLARDCMGVKPLYYEIRNGVLRFSSELSALLQGNQKIDSDALSLYLSLEYVPSPYTLIDGIKKIPPGHILHFQNGVSHLTEYSNTFVMPPYTSSVDLYGVINEAVREQLVSERPVGIFLSGGFDSSIVLHHAQKYQRDIRTFSIDFEMISGQKEEEFKFNTDALLAQKTATYYGVPHTIFTLSLNDVRNNILSVYEKLDEPIGDLSGLPRYFLSQSVRNEGIVVALGGDGGDELFGGYNRHRALMSAYIYHQFPLWIQKKYATRNIKAQKLLLDFPVPIHLAYMASDYHMTQSMSHMIIDMELLHAFFEHQYRNAPNKMHPLDQFMRVDRRTWMPDLSLALSDRFSMAHGLEFRVPLLSTNVVTYSDSISVYTKTSPWSGKKIIKKSYKNHLPAHLFNQPKRGWLAPGAKWLRDPYIYNMVKEILSNEYHSGLNGVFNWKLVQKALDDHVEGRVYHRQILWNIIILQIWARKNKVCL